MCFTMMEKLSLLGIDFDRTDDEYFEKYVINSNLDKIFNYSILTEPRYSYTTTSHSYFNTRYFTNDYARMTGICSPELELGMLIEIHNKIFLVYNIEYNYYYHCKFDASEIEPENVNYYT